MRHYSYEGREIDTFDIEDSRIVIKLMSGPEITLTVIEDHGYPMIELEEEHNDNIR